MWRLPTRSSIRYATGARDWAIVRISDFAHPIVPIAFQLFGRNENVFPVFSTLGVDVSVIWISVGQQSALLQREFTHDFQCSALGGDLKSA
jgi:hypothetical protein